MTSRTPRRAPGRRLALAALLQVLLAPAMAAGAPGEDRSAAVHRLVAEAESAVVSRRYAEAVSLYDAAWALSPDPAYQFNIAMLCLNRLDDPEGAWEHALLLQESARGESDRVDAEDLLGKAAAALGRTRGRATFEVSPAEAQVTVDGKAATSRSPRAAWLPAGSHAVQVTAPGFRSQEARLDVEAGGQVTLSVRLEPEGGTLRVLADVAGARVTIDDQAPVDAPAERRVAPGAHSVRVEAAGRIPWRQQVVVTASKSSVLQAVLAPVPAAKPWRRTAGWVSVGTAGASLAAGLATWFLGRRDATAAGNLLPRDYADYGAYKAAFDARVGQARSKGIASYALWGVGAAAAGVGLYFLLAPDGGPAVSLAPGPGTAGVTASVAF
jgi:hypothetical protein